MEFENILEEPKKIKVRKKFTIPLIVIAFLIVILVVILAFLYFNDGNPKDIYVSVIDDVKENVIISLDEAEKIIEKPVSMSGNVNMEMVAETEEMKDITDILNNLDISYSFESDYTSKKANYDIDAKYENENLVNLGLNVKDNEMFVNLGSLFNKDIRFSGDETEIIWETYDFDSYKIVVEEFANELKNNLKDEYFSKEKEMLKIDGKKKFTSKYIINLNSKDLYDIEINLYDSLKKNDNFLSSLAKLNGVTKNEIINQINSYRNEVEQDDELSLKIVTYVNLFTKQVVKVSVTDSGDTIHLVKRNKTSYEIVTDEDSSVIGNLVIKEDLIEVEYQYNDEKFKLEMTETDLNFNYDIDTNKISLNLSVKGDKCNYLVEMITKEDSMDAKISVDGVMENITKISDKMNINYVDYDKITDEDYMTIYQSVYQNQALMSLIQDIYYLDYSIETPSIPTY